MFKLAVAATVATAAAHTRSTFDAKEFRQLGRATQVAPKARMTFSVGLPTHPGGFETLDAKLADISNPKSANYGNWLSQQEVLDLIAPEAAVRSEVSSWLAAKGASCIDWPSALRCTASPASVESMFNTEISAFAVEGSSKVIYRAHPSVPFYLPAELKGKLLFASGVADFPTKRMRMGSGIRAAQATDYMVAMETLYAFYGTNAVTGNSAATLGPAEFQADQAILTSDISDFATNNGIPNWSINTTVGPFSGSDTEATLDEEYMAGVAQGNTNWFWVENDWMYEWVQNLANATTLPQVFSVSWGWSEADQCSIDQVGPCASGNDTGSAAYVAACNQGFAAATARGTTILVASGDSGAHGRTDGGCASPMTLPDWPAASQYILSVGATQISNGQPLANPQTPVCKTSAGGAACAGSGTEIVSSTATGALIVSGGGFSNVAPQPSWQAQAVSTYLASGALLPPVGDFNATGRGYPDVAAFGHNVVIYQGGPLPVDGTSCSSPIFAGVISLANAQRLAAGKKVLGFVNPAIYQVSSTPGVFTDVVTGDNTCTEDGCTPGCTGFGATKGWDATTGWGTPKASALIAALAAL